MNLAHRTDRTFLLLLLLSFASLVAFETTRGGAMVGSMLVGLAALKAQLVVSGFMHLRWTHRPYRQLLVAWSVVVFLVLASGIAAVSPESINV